MDVNEAFFTDVGRVRTNNEDFYLADSDIGLYVVCDGMGGHSAGEVASKMTAEVVQREIAKASKPREKFLKSGKTSDIRALAKVMENALSTACKEVYKHASKKPELAGMGTTCTAVLLAGHGKGLLGHVGDSRLYVFRNGAIHQLSQDHTYVNELVKRGAISKEQAENHPQGNVLSRAVGVQPSVSVDSMIFDIDAGDTYLLCSDGLYNYFPDSGELAQYLQQSELQAAIESCVNVALERGGHDNVTAVSLRVGGTPPPVENATGAEQRIRILKRIPIFSHLNYHELVKVVGLTQLGSANEGQKIISEGEHGDELYVVLAGEVDVLKGDQVIVQLKAGAHIGEMALVDNAPRSASVVATSKVNLLIMRRDEFFSLIRAEPVIATKLLWSFVQVMSGRLRETSEQLKGVKAELDTDLEDFEIFVDDEP